MGCLLLTSIFAGPRAGIFFWWIFNPGRWDRAFDTWIWPVIGFVLAPWTTLAFVAVAPAGTIEGLDYAVLAVAFTLDLFSLVGEGGLGRRGLSG